MEVSRTCLFVCFHFIFQGFGWFLFIPLFTSQLIFLLYSPLSKALSYFPRSHYSEQSLLRCQVLPMAEVASRGFSEAFFCL